MESFFLNILMIFICIMFIMINKLGHCPNLSAVQIQNFIWLLAFVLYLIKIVDYYPLSEIVYLMTFLYLFGFNIANFGKNKTILYTNYTFETNYQSISSDIENRIEYENSTYQRIGKRCIVASVISWGLSIPILRKSIPILLQYGLSEGMNALRYRTYSEYTIFSTLEMCLMNYIIRPIFIVTIIFMAEQIALRKKGKMLILVSLADAFLLVLMTAGRAMMVSLVLYVFFAIVLLHGVKILNILKKYRKYIIPAVIVLTVIIYISTKRINRDVNIFQELIIYYFSGPHYFSSMLREEIAKPFVLMGKGILSPIIDLPIFVSKYFGFNLSGGSQYLSTLANPSLSIGNGVATNATASTLLAFYSDFGIIGPLLAGFVLGKFSLRQERKLAFDFNSLNFAKYLFIVVGVAISVQNYSFVGIATSMTWIFMMILLKE